LSRDSHPDCRAATYVRHDEPHPDAAIRSPWYALDSTYVMEEGEAVLPQAPIK
jgi:catechol 1,2-dioxygenase